VSTSEIAEIRA